MTDPTETVSLALTQKLLGTATSVHVRDMVNALAQEEVASGIHIINTAIDTGSDPRQFGKQIVDCLRNVLLAQTASADLVEASKEEREAFEGLAQDIDRARLLKTIRAFNEAVNAYTGGWQPQLALELALIESLQQPIAQSRQTITADPGANAPAKSEAGKAKDSPEIESSENETYERAQLSAPGEPPAYSVLKIHEGWTDILSRAYRYNKSIPPLLDNAHVRAIAGNRLILGVTNDVFVPMIEAPKRARVLEQAIFDLHNVKLRIEVRVVDRVIEPQESEVAVSNEDEDPLISAGKLLGGVVDDSE